MTKKELLDELQRFMENRVEGMKKILDNPKKKGEEGWDEYYSAMKAWAELITKWNEETPTKEAYENPYLVDYYMEHFGYAYAFQYWVMYDAILRDFQDSKNLNVGSIGCGSMIDAWSLAYAYQRIKETNPDVITLPEKMTYCGTDGAKWGKLFLGPEGEIPQLHEYYLEVQKPYEYLGKNIEEIGDNHLLWINSDVLMFGKIINELSQETLEELIVNLRNTKFEKDKIFLCFSKAGDKYIKQIVEAVNNNGEYNIDGEIMELSPLYESMEKIPLTHSYYFRPNSNYGKKLVSSAYYVYNPEFRDLSYKSGLKEISGYRELFNNHMERIGIKNRSYIEPMQHMDPYNPMEIFKLYK